MSAYQKWDVYAAGAVSYQYWPSEQKFWPAQPVPQAPWTHPAVHHNDFATNTTGNESDTSSTLTESPLVRIAIDHELILLHEDKFDYWSENWRNVMVQEYCGASARRGKVYGCWEYKGCEPSVFRCLQQWLHEQKIPQDGSILEAGYRGTSFRGAENQDQNQNQQLTHSRKIAITEPLPCQLAVDLYFTAWDLDMPQLMDDALTVLYDHYAKVKHPPSPGMVRRVFSNGNYPVGQHLHFLFADLYLKFGVLDHGQSAWANNDVEIWLWDFLQFFLGRCRMLDLQQRIPSPTRVHTAQDGGLRKANGEVAQRSGLAGRLCDYHHHAGCFGGRQPRRGRCEYLKLKRVE